MWSDLDELRYRCEQPDPLPATAPRPVRTDDRARKQRRCMKLLRDNRRKAGLNAKGLPHGGKGGRPKQFVKNRFAG